MPNTIKPANGWQHGGSLYPVLAHAQQAALKDILASSMGELADKAAAAIVAAKDEVVKILTVSEPRSRKRRSDFGTHRPAKKKPAANPPASKPQPQ